MGSVCVCVGGGGGGNKMPSELKNFLKWYEKYAGAWLWVGNLPGWATKE